MQSGVHDWIRLRGLRIEGARVGVYPSERDNPRPIIVDLGVATSVGGAANSQRLGDTIDYDALAQVIREVSLSRHFKLIETLCEDLARIVMERFGVARVAVEIHKPAACRGATASVAIERGRAAVEGGRR